jgi:hypothetical protein
MVLHTWVFGLSSSMSRTRDINSILGVAFRLIIKTYNLMVISLSIILIKTLNLALAKE